MTGVQTCALPICHAGDVFDELEPLIKDVARMTADPMIPLDDLRATYEGHPEFRMPLDWQP